MKSFGTIFILIVAASVAFAVNPAEVKAKMMKVFTECKASTGASDDDCAKLMIHAKPDTREGKCMFSCVMENMGIVKAGKLDEVNMKAWADSMGAPSSVVDAVVAECGGLSDPDTCEAATTIGLCFVSVAKNKGVDTSM